MKSKFKKLIEALRQVEMTEGERVAMYFNATSQARPKPSPYFHKFSFLHFARVVGSFAMIVVIGITGLSYASASALPGEPLYAVKINLKENIEDWLIFSSEKRIALSEQRIELRFSEAKTLIKKKKITSKTLSIVEAKIQENKEKIGDALEEINKENPEAATVAKTDLETSIKESGEEINTLIVENKIEATTGEDIHYGETDTKMESVDGIILPILKEDPSSTETTPTPADGSIIQDLKVVPDPLDILPPAEEVDGINSDTNKSN
jgi:hypothetical protein